MFVFKHTEHKLASHEAKLSKNIKNQLTLSYYITVTGNKNDKFWTGINIFSFNRDRPKNITRKIYKNMIGIYRIYDWNDSEYDYYRIKVTNNNHFHPLLINYYCWIAKKKFFNFIITNFH